MSYEIVGIAILWTFLFGYLLVASIDFGAGFFSFYSVLTGHQNKIHNIIQRYLSPVWEVTNVFLIFFVVGLNGFFPDAAYYYGTALLVPGSIAIVLLAIRGVYYAYNTYGHSGKNNIVYMALYGATGLLIPAALSTVLAISEGGIIVENSTGVHLQWGQLLSNPYTWAVIILALVSVLYISAMFLSFYAKRAGDKVAFEIVRGYALLWSAPTILASLLAFFQINKQNPDHFTNMLNIAWMFVASFICFAGAVYLVWQRRHLGVSFILVMLQFAFAWYGYGRSHLPYVLYPYINVYDSFTNSTMAYALITAFVAGLLVLIPSLILILRLFLFDAKYVRGHEGKKG
ncbi:MULTISPECIES: cytochrome d ubiquinol oxidase subunit II [Paenibacillus]|uniref:Cytochrome d ubiquinol oxidase subunit II n=2 Tax=Paenibacillus TaxID=44249 RepID=A0A0K2FCX4_9BACL|nr:MULTISPECIES: cytochrome d ubiquinol oxidase subunit II [Paenibacillus]KAF6629204.1 cytochrome d ubiquinol oxidase subunit II [Paenibacillus sp. EKM208P]MBP1173006.1 cytochrome d ubiquinol oxidase subunit II [Paenibacillus sp. PvR133]MCP3746875.1 cytochrome d ubiquinol oxidase subunit II [Paenibacillus sp. A3M_27_13]MXO77632.1 cytochrome d ubiquinol oxidase subunit II [Paenibacillus sp. OT2-17]AIW41591.1 cytochrome D ubiquinol oxidase subunit II [Paenibacillus polymyxa CR1]